MLLERSVQCNTCILALIVVSISLYFVIGCKNLYVLLNVITNCKYRSFVLHILVKFVYTLAYILAFDYINLLLISN